MLFFHFRLGNTIICHSPKSGVKSATFVDSSTLAFAFGIQTYMDIKNGIKTRCAVMGIRSKMSTVEGLLRQLIFLPVLLACAIIALAIIAEQFG